MADAEVKSKDRWKTKHRQRDSAARMRVIKRAKLDASVSSPASASTSSATCSAGQQPAESSDSENERPRNDDSENERPRDDGEHSSDEEDEFDAQQAFDDWIVSLKLIDRKMLSVLLTNTLQKRFNIKATAAALESAWITGFNEKTVRYYCKEFMENKGDLGRRGMGNTRSCASSMMKS